MHTRVKFVCSEQIKIQFENNFQAPNFQGLNLKRVCMLLFLFTLRIRHHKYFVAKDTKIS